MSDFLAVLFCTTFVLVSKKINKNLSRIGEGKVVLIYVTSLFFFGILSGVVDKNILIQKTSIKVLCLFVVFFACIVGIWKSAKK